MNIYRITLNGNRIFVVEENYGFVDDDNEETALATYADIVADHCALKPTKIAHQDQQGHELWETVFANGDVILMRHIH